MLGGAGSGWRSTHVSPSLPSVHAAGGGSGGDVPAGGLRAGDAGGAGARAALWVRPLEVRRVGDPGVAGDTDTGAGRAVVATKGAEVKDGGVRYPACCPASHGGLLVAPAGWGLATGPAPSACLPTSCCGLRVVGKVGPVPSATLRVPSSVACMCAVPSGAGTSAGSSCSSVLEAAPLSSLVMTKPISPEFSRPFPALAVLSGAAVLARPLFPGSPTRRGLRDVLSAPALPLSTGSGAEGAAGAQGARPRAAASHAGTVPASTAPAG